MVTVPPRLVLLQTDPAYAVDFATHWLYRRDAEGVWRMVRMLSALELMQAEDQRDYGIVITPTHIGGIVPDHHEDDPFLLGQPMGWKAATVFLTIMAASIVIPVLYYLNQ